MAQQIDPRWDHETYEQTVFATREELTAMSKLLLDPDTSWFKIIVNLLRVMALNIIFAIRQKMHEEELWLGKQIYKQKRSRAADGSLDNDPLD